MADAGVDRSAGADRLVLDVHERVLGMLDGGVDRSTVASMVRDLVPLASGAEVTEVVDRVVARVRGLGRLEPLLADPAVTDVLVNGPGAVWVERAGRLERTDVVLDADDIGRVIERVVSPLGLRVDRSSPIVDARLADGSRVNAVVPPLAVDGPVVAIRRFGVAHRSLDELCEPSTAALLRWAVRARCNVVVSGGTGAGKTTLLNALASELPEGERIVTVEDVAELRLPHGHVVRLEARPANSDGLGSVTIRDLVRNALRLRPDRIIVGEVRGPEALDMMQAMNTGHEGSLSTCHANSPLDAIRRLETMVLFDGAALPLTAIRDQLSSSIDLIVQITRRPDGARSVSSVAEVGAEPDGGDRVPVRRLTADGHLVDRPIRPVRAPGIDPFTGVGDDR